MRAGCGALPNGKAIEACAVGVVGAKLDPGFESTTTIPVFQILILLERIYSNSALSKIEPTFLLCFF